MRTGAAQYIFLAVANGVKVRCQQRIHMAERGRQYRPTISIRRPSQMNLLVTVTAQGPCLVFDSGGNYTDDNTVQDKNSKLNAVKQR